MSTAQQYQPWNIEGTATEAVLMIKDQKGLIVLTANSCKSLRLAVRHVQADKKNSHVASDFSENMLHTLPLNCPSPALIFAYV